MLRIKELLSSLLYFALCTRLTTKFLFVYFPWKWRSHKSHFVFYLESFPLDLMCIMHMSIKCEYVARFRLSPLHWIFSLWRNFQRKPIEMFERQFKQEVMEFLIEKSISVLQLSVEMLKLDLRIFVLNLNSRGKEFWREFYKQKIYISK